eukprot:3150831-Prymnesium_polylepis.1
MKPVSLDEIEDGVRRVDRVVSNNRTVCCGVFFLFVAMLGFLVWMCIMLTRIDAALAEENVASVLGTAQQTMSSLSSIVEGLREYVASNEANISSMLLQGTQKTVTVVGNYSVGAERLSHSHPELRVDLMNPTSSAISIVED